MVGFSGRVQCAYLQSPAKMMKLPTEKRADGALDRDRPGRFCCYAATGSLVFAWSGCGTLRSFWFRMGAINRKFCRWSE